MPFIVPYGWTEDEIDIFLDNILYNKVDALNDVCEIVNKTLDEIVQLTYDLKMGGKTRMLIKIPCTYCGKENLYQRQ